MKIAPPPAVNPPENDAYITLASQAEAEMKVQGSRFIGYALPVSSIEEFMEHLESLRKKYYDATHHCFAYRMGVEGDTFRYSDDGEPSGTAGKRILGAIDKHNLTDCGVVIVRYFGGTKLGVGGLARAYSESADAVLRNAKRIKRYLKNRYNIRFPYEATKSVHHDIETYGAEILDRIYGEDVIYEIQVRRSRDSDFRRDVTGHTQRTVEFFNEYAGEQ